jgi:Rod binding domain-containing protein
VPVSSTGLAATASSSPMNGAADSLVKQANQLTSGKGSDDNKKIHKAGQDFESLLLGQWLQQAEDSFGKLPGSDEDEDGDAGSSSMQGIAMQSLGQAMAASGGIGISRMITHQLEQKATTEADVSQKSS